MGLTFGTSNQTQQLLEMGIFAMRELLLVIILMLQVSTLDAHRATAPQNDVGDLLAGLSDTESTIRRASFYHLIGLGGGANQDGSSSIPADTNRLLQLFPQQAAAIKTALIDLLLRENQYDQTAKAKFMASAGTEGVVTEDYTNYYGDVVVAVAALKDERSAFALLGALSTGHPAIGTLAGFGGPILDAVIGRLTDSDEVVRGAATLVLLEMLNPENRGKVGDPVSISKLRAALNAVALDSSFVVSTFALEALGRLFNVPVTGPIARVQIDALPGDPIGTINLGSKGTILVVVFSTSLFDSGAVDLSSIRFGAGRTAPQQATFKDVNGDKRRDLLLEFTRGESGIACGDTAVFLFARTTDGDNIAGVDSIRTIGCK